MEPFSERTSPNSPGEDQYLRQELAQSIEYQKASADILRIISAGLTDIQPVFDAIVQAGHRLIPGSDFSIALADGQEVKAIAFASSKPEHAAIWKTRFPHPLTREYFHGEAILDRRIVDVPDVREVSDTQAAGMQNMLGSPYRANTLVPLLRNEEAIGAIAVPRTNPGPLTERQLSLLHTFAEQAVIAIENVRQFHELQARLDREAATREILQVISQSRNDEAPVFDIILQSLMRLCDTPQAALYLVSEDRLSLEIVASRGAGRGELDRLRREQPIPLSNEHSSFVQAYRLKEPLHIEDIQATARWRGTDETPLKSAVRLANMRTVLQVPLMSGETCIGVLCVYRNEIKPYTEDEIALHRTFAAQAVIAIENVRQFKALQARTEEVHSLNETLEARVEAQVAEIERMGRLKRFLPAAVADTVVSRGSEKLLSSHRALLGVLFCDIRGFTAFCETAEPEETIEVLQKYHEAMGKLIADHGAGVDHRMGDGIMVLFNDPLPCDDPAGSAVRLAIAMRAEMVEICRKWKRLGYRLGFGVGISLGYATVGMVGHEGRYDYTASGTAVNLAARLSDLADDGEILFSPRAYTAVEEDFSAEPRGEMSLKGIREPVQVYRLIEGSIET
jgi:class 3 adenylate cyclase